MAQTIGSLDLNAFSDLYSDSTQYFWFESNASATYGAGAHVTLVPDTTFISNPTGQNILMNTDGFSIRNGLLPMMTLDNDSLDFNFVDTTAGTYTTMATFGLSGMRIYSRDSSNNLVQLANIGYGEGQAETGTSITPYYTFGTRASGSTIGNYSIAEGYNLTASYPYAHAEGVDTTAGFTAAHAEGDGTQALRYASHSEGWDTVARGSASHAEGLESRAYGDYSHAEGYDTEAGSNASHAEGDGTTANGTNSHAEGHSTTSSGNYSHAEGWYSTASSNCSHAEGHQTTASAYYSHAEGYFTVASGTNSHAGGSYTITQRKSQTALGEYNIADTSGGNESVRGDYVLIIGNGTAVSARSNALTVDWDGDVDLPTGKFSGVGATLTYNASNSGTNALEINNASSNALTVDWNGNVIGQAMAGIIQMYAGATPPTGWLICDGASYLRSDYPTLFAALGGTSSPWGLPDSTHFNVPDLRGRAPIGAGTGTGLTARAIGDTFGEETHTLIEDEVPAHTHGSKTLEGTMRIVGWAGSATNAAVSGIVTVTANNVKDRTASSGSSMGSQTNKITATHTHTSFGGGGAHENMQPSAVVNFIICTGKTS